MLGTVEWGAGTRLKTVKMRLLGSWDQSIVNASIEDKQLSEGAVGVLPLRKPSYPSGVSEDVQVWRGQEVHRMFLRDEIEIRSYLEVGSLRSVGE